MPDLYYNNKNVALTTPLGIVTSSPLSVLLMTELSESTLAAKVPEVLQAYQDVTATGSTKKWFDELKRITNPLNLSAWSNNAIAGAPFADNLSQYTNVANLSASPVTAASGRLSWLTPATVNRWYNLRSGTARNFMFVADLAHTGTAWSKKDLYITLGTLTDMTLQGDLRIETTELKAGDYIFAPKFEITIPFKSVY